jgi:hypothetical protein
VCVCVCVCVYDMYMHTYTHVYICPPHSVPADDDGEPSPPKRAPNEQLTPGKPIFEPLSPHAGAFGSEADSEEGTLKKPTPFAATAIAAASTAQAQSTEGAVVGAGASLADAAAAAAAAADQAASRVAGAKGGSDSGSVVITADEELPGTEDNEVFRDADQPGSEESVEGAVRDAVGTEH